MGQVKEDVKNLLPTGEKKAQELVNVSPHSPPDQHIRAKSFK